MDPDEYGRSFCAHGDEPRILHPDGMSHGPRAGPSVVAQLAAALGESGRSESCGTLFGLGSKSCGFQVECLQAQARESPPRAPAVYTLLIRSGATQACSNDCWALSAAPLSLPCSRAISLTPGSAGRTCWNQLRGRQGIRNEACPLGALPITDRTCAGSGSRRRVRTRVARARGPQASKLGGVQLSGALLGPEAGHQPNDPPFPVKCACPALAGAGCNGPRTLRRACWIESS